MDELDHEKSTTTLNHLNLHFLIGFDQMVLGQNSHRLLDKKGVKQVGVWTVRNKRNRNKNFT